MSRSKGPGALAARGASETDELAGRVVCKSSPGRKFTQAPISAVLIGSGRCDAVGTTHGASSPTPHRKTPVKCAACGKRVQRKGRKQKYCSRRCRQRHYWDRRALAKISAFVTHDTGRSTTPQKSSCNVNGLQRRNSGQTVFENAPQNLLGGGGWRWAGTVTLDPAVRKTITHMEIGGRFVQLATAAAIGAAP